MNERISFPDVEATLVSFVAGELAELADSAQVVTRVPDPRPARMVRVRRDDRKWRDDCDLSETRRRQNSITDQSRVVLECSDEAGEAGVLAGRVRSILSAASPGYLGSVWCDHIDDIGVENDADPETSAPRLTVVADIYVRGTVLA
ncbi:hypothetical protein ACFWPK_26990 [Nocardia sp. NPDC058519]|uniref:hypothetical protein n=1 Tax=Nocardia sp. NPDC058519 TaxID=3346535 RepID=UPI003669ECFF